MHKRKTFGKLKEVYDLPHMLDVQVHSYKEFLQADAPVSQRRNIGLQEVFEEIFPIEDADRSVKLEFIHYTLGKPKYDLAECKRRGLTFAAPLKAKFRLT